MADAGQTGGLSSIRLPRFSAGFALHGDRNLRQRSVNHPR
jgi:hypothetical protein